MPLANIEIPQPCKPHKKHLSKIEAASKILDILHDARMLPSDFIALVLDDATDTFAPFHTAFFADGNSNKLHHLLETIWKNDG